jgi:hypothetical protein
MAYRRIWASAVESVPTCPSAPPCTMVYDIAQVAAVLLVEMQRCHATVSGAAVSDVRTCTV